MRNIVNISLPPELNKQLEKMVKEGHYASKSEFIRHLLRAKQKGDLVSPRKETEEERVFSREILSIKEIKKKAVPILKKAGVRRASIFGSVVRGEATPESDIDMLVELDKEKKMDLIDFVGIKQDLQEALNKKVDLVTFNSVHRLLKDRIMKDRVAIL